jgi:hypothetical protein
MLAGHCPEAYPEKSRPNYIISRAFSDRINTNLGLFTLGFNGFPRPRTGWALPGVKVTHK